jgi:hypothetical protein
MLSQVISLRRLRFYESECHRGAAAANDALARIELNKFEEAFGRAATELQAVCDALLNEARQQTPPAIGVYAPTDSSSQGGEGKDRFIARPE